MQAKIADNLQALKNDCGIDIILSICQDCKQVLGVKLGYGTNGISHSICPECKNKIKNQLQIIRGKRENNHCDCRN